MKEGYQVRDESAVHFLTFTIVDWVDVFTRKAYRDFLIDSLNFCIKNKGAVVYGFVIMSNHVHFLLQSNTGKLTALIRDFKKWTSVQMLDAIRREPESRREWMLHRFSWNASLRESESNYKVWTHNNQPMEVYSETFFRQKLSYIHQNPVRAGWVEAEEEYLYSSARFFHGRSCGIEITRWS